jgi:Uma2 family endonuclease
MAVPQLKEPFTAQDYFAWEQDQPTRYEYLEGEIFNMAGASHNHNVVSLNAAIGLRNQLRGTPCNVFVTDMRVELVRDEHYVYPDVFVSCDPRDKTPAANYQKQFPCLVIEVLSPSTAQYDQNTKLERYLAMPSVMQVVLINPETRSAELHTRSLTGEWAKTQLNSASTIAFALGFSIPLADFFIDML